MNVVHANGIDIAYQIEGTLDPACPWIVFAHSLATDLRLWDEQIAPFAADWRVLRYDIRGHGGSTATPGPYSLELLADDLKALLDELLIGQVHFVGLSLGGMIGQQFALRHPIRLRSLTLADTSSRAAPDAPTLWESRRARVESLGMNAVVTETLERWFTPGFRARHPDRVARIAELIRATPPAGYAGCAHAVARIALTPRLGVIGCPVLVLVGEQDHGTPLAQAEAIARAIPQSRLTVLRDAAHLSNVEQAAAFNAALERFLLEQE